MKKRPIPKFLPPGLRAFRERRLPLRRWKASGSPIQGTRLNLAWFVEVQKAILDGVSHRLGRP